MGEACHRVYPARLMMSAQKKPFRRKRSSEDLAAGFREQFEAQQESVSVLKDGLVTLEQKN